VDSGDGQRSCGRVVQTHETGSFAGRVESYAKAFATDILR